MKLQKTSVGNSPVGKTIVEAVYQDLRRRILTGALSPGAQLKFAPLRVAFGVSMGSLREALTRLAAERLVVNIGQQGFKVAPLTVEEMHDVMWLRAELDVLAVTDAIAHGDEEWEASIVAAYHRLSKVPLEHIDGSNAGTERVEELHVAFHSAIIAGCRSPWLRHFHDRLDEHSLRYRRIRLSGLPVKILRDTFLQEHREIMESVLARDSKAAALSVRTHIQRTQKALEAMFASSSQNLRAIEP